MTLMEENEIAKETNNKACFEMCDYLTNRFLALRPRSLMEQIEKGLLAHAHYIQSRQVHSVKSNFSVSGVPYPRRYCLMQKLMAKRTSLGRQESVARPAHFPFRYIHYASVHGDILPGKKLLILSNSAPRPSTTGCLRPYTVIPILVALSSSCIASFAYSQGSRGANPFGGFLSERRRLAK